MDFLIYDIFMKIELHIECDNDSFYLWLLVNSESYHNLEDLVNISFEPVPKIKKISSEN
jgi:hypothetical protein